VGKMSERKLNKHQLIYQNKKLFMASGNKESVCLFYNERMIEHDLTFFSNISEMAAALLKLLY
jgi:hypothetical protein